MEIFRIEGTVDRIVDLSPTAREVTLQIGRAHV